MSMGDKLTTIAENEQKVYDSGYSKAESDFWDRLQQSGTRDYYEYGFAYWGNEYIRPKYKVVPKTRAISMFASCSNLKVVEKEYFDLSNCTTNNTTSTQGNYCVFRDCVNLQRVEDIGIKPGYYYNTFFNCKKLETIDVLRCEKETMFANTFSDCNKLKNITIEGVIGQNFNVGEKRELLTHGSLMSFINALYDYAADGDTSTHTLTIGATNLDKLTDSEKAIATQKGWTLA